MQKERSGTPEPGRSDVPDQSRWLVEEVLRAAREIRFGSIEITIHDSRVVQIERKEKVRPGGGP